MECTEAPSQLPSKPDAGSRRRVAIVQSNYIPWKGYFDLINRVDHFVLYDDVQYTPRDWRNRNRIIAATGPHWLTIPVRHLERSQKIQEITVADADWAGRHWRSIAKAYGRAPGFAEHREFFETLYLGPQPDHLSEINHRFLRAICDLLGIPTTFSWSRDWLPRGDRSERLLDVCLQLGASVYVSGPSARCYLDEARFQEAGVAVEWMSYDRYPEYPQRHGQAFVHEVSVLDLILNVGAEGAWQYLRSPRRVVRLPA